MGTDKNGGMVVTSSPNGTPLVKLTSTENGGGIATFSAKGTPLVGLGVNANGDGVVETFEADGGMRMFPGP